MQNEQVLKGLEGNPSPFTESEQAEIVRDLQKLGMSPEQIEEAMQAPESGADPLEKYEHLVFENIILFYEARRKVKWPEIRYCQHRHTTIEAARRCAKKNGPEWYVAKSVACGFEGQLLDDMFELEKKILLMKEQPFEVRSERLSDSQLDHVFKNNRRDIQKAKSMCGTRSIQI